MASCYSSRFFSGVVKFRWPVDDVHEEGCGTSGVAALLNYTGIRGMSFYEPISVIQYVTMEP
jgi:hypothetical protein